MSTPGRRSSVCRAAGRRGRRIARGLGLLAVAFSAGPSFAVAEPNADQLQAMYNDAMHQLQQAQDRKNQLANENEQLKAQLAHLQQLVQQSDHLGDPLNGLRARAASFESFLGLNPDVALRFAQFEKADIAWQAARDGNPADLLGVGWPFRDVEVQTLVVLPSTEPSTQPSTESSTRPTTGPSSQPATQPGTEPSSQPSTQPTIGPATAPATPPATSPSTSPATTQAG